MPTHKLWIEHTERAAWQSVDALRDKLAEAEQRAARLSPPVEGWPALLQALDALHAEQKLAGETHAERVRALVSKLGSALVRVRELEAELERSRATSTVPRFTGSEPVPRRSLPDDERGEPSRGLERLSREIARRHSELRQGRFDPEGTLADVESRLSDLVDLDPGELFDAAADLSALALAVRRAASSDD